MPYGIPEDSFNRIMDIFKDEPKISSVKLFGSRALGRHRSGSDIDLALEGKNLILNDQLALYAKLDNLMLPYRVDLVILDDQVNANLREHINRVGISIYPK